MNVVPNQKLVSFRKDVLLSFMFYCARIYLNYFEKCYHNIPTVSRFFFIHLGCLCQWLLTSL